MIEFTLDRKTADWVDMSLWIKLLVEDNSIVDKNARKIHKTPEMCKKWKQV